MRKNEKAAAVLVVNDERSVRQALSMALESSYEVFQAAGGKEAMDIVRQNNVDLVLLDILLPDVDGIILIGKLKSTDPHLEVVMVTAVREIRTAVKAIKAGAYEYVVKPFVVDEVRNVIHRALEKHRLTREVACLRRELESHKPFEKMVGRDEKMRHVYQVISMLARNDETVLVQGESGTGKELVARAIHNLSHRWNKPFTVLNCAAVPQTLIERELFGHNRGAFTNATKTLPGKLEITEGGTVFLDDIDTIETNTQAKLLRVIQHKEFERLGGNKTIRADIRFVAASNRDLHSLIREGRFREDLFFRLNVFPVHIPPLRHRRSDIPLLANHFLKRHRGNGQGNPVRFSKEALKRLIRYDWPGNVRELENLVLHVCTVTRKNVISAQDLPLNQPSTGGTGIKPLKKAIEDFERAYIGDVLEQFNGSRRQTAERLDIHRNTLLGKISRLGL
ncbi:MAG: sigma-54-dependent transcriptional regulator [Thermodesulfobacteriota bacterium]